MDAIGFALPRVGISLPVFRKSHPYWSKWISLAVGAAGMALAAATFTFPVWQNALRAILNQTETQSNIMAQVGTVGTLIAFPAGIMFERYGSQINTIIGGIVFGSTLFILTLATSVWKSFFSENMWLIYLIWFIHGLGNVSLYMGSLMPNVLNFKANDRGKVLGFLDMASSLGPTLLSYIYNIYFTNGYINSGEEGEQNLSGYFSFLTVVTTVICVCLFFFSGRIDDDSSEIAQGDVEAANLLENEVQNIDDYAEPKPPNFFSEYPFAERDFWSILPRWNFRFFIAQFALAGCCQLTFQNNISTYLKSFNLSDRNLLFTTLNTALQAITKLIAGFISDIVAQGGKMPRAVVYLVPYVLQTIMFTISIFHGDNFIILILTCIFVGMGFGVNWCQSPTLLGELFGEKHLASNWGWSMLVTGILGFPYSLAFSSVYESAIIQPGESYCYGIACFTWSFALMAVSSFCALIMALGLSQNMLRNGKIRRSKKR